MLICYTHDQKGLPSAVPKSENQSREKERKNKKIKDDNKKDEKYKEHKLHQVTDGIANNRIKHHDSHTLQLKNRQEKVCFQPFFPLLCIVFLH